MNTINKQPVNQVNKDVIIVTGSSGLIGRAVIRKLASDYQWLALTGPAHRIHPKKPFVCRWT